MRAQLLISACSLAILGVGCAPARTVRVVGRQGSWTVELDRGGVRAGGVHEPLGSAGARVELGERGEVLRVTRDEQLAPGSVELVLPGAGPGVVFLSARLREGFAPRKRDLLAAMERTASQRRPVRAIFHDEDEVVCLDYPRQREEIESALPDRGSGGDLVRALEVYEREHARPGDVLWILSDYDLGVRRPLPASLIGRLERLGVRVTVVRGDGSPEEPLFRSLLGLPGAAARESLAEAGAGAR